MLSQLRVSTLRTSIGGGARVRLDDALDALFDVAGTRVEVVRTGAVAGDVDHTSAAIDAAAELLDYRPGVGLADGLAAQWDWILATRGEAVV